MNRTERFREIAAQHKEDDLDDDSSYYWYYETEPGNVVIGDHTLTVVENTNYNAEQTLNGADESGITWNIWVIVEFEGDFYRLKGTDDSWEGGQFEDWQRVEKRPVTTIEYVEVDND